MFKLTASRIERSLALAAPVVPTMISVLPPPMSNTVTWPLSCRPESAPAKVRRASSLPSITRGATPEIAQHCRVVGQAGQRSLAGGVEEPPVAVDPLAQARHRGALEHWAERAALGVGDEQRNRVGSDVYRGGAHGFLEMGQNRPIYPFTCRSRGSSG